MLDADQFCSNSLYCKNVLDANLFCFDYLFYITLEVAADYLFCFIFYVSSGDAADFISLMGGEPVNCNVRRKVIKQQSPRNLII